MNGWYETTRKNPYIYTLDYQSLFIDTVMPAVLAVDGTRPFISTSPTNGLLFKESSSSTDGYCGRVLMERWKAENNDWYGDVHVFNYTDDGTDVLKFRRPRFASGMRDRRDIR